jgi:hypothetical protein
MKSDNYPVHRAVASTRLAFPSSILLFAPFFFSFIIIINNTLFGISVVVEAFLAHHPRQQHRGIGNAVVVVSGRSHLLNNNYAIAREVATAHIRCNASLRSSSYISALQSSESNNVEEKQDASTASVAAGVAVAAQNVMRSAETKSRLTAEEKSFVSFLFNMKETSASSSAVVGDENTQLVSLENAIKDRLQDMSPGLLVALQLAAKMGEWKENDNEDDEEKANTTTLTVDKANNTNFETQMVQVGTALQNVLDTRLRSGRNLLTELLNSGEIRKLDSLIGKAAREGKLDMSFFSVLSMNMQDAAMENSDNSINIDSSINNNDGADVVATSTTSQEDESNGQEPITTNGNNSANRAQILQHIYTRCQEELEKNVPPGMGLLNKLLRTEISSIRTNQLQYYLGPQATSITSPDGKTIELSNNGTGGKALVSHGEFIGALSQAVSQIRTLEKSGGTDRVSAMNLIENIRRVAMEARVVLVDSYGEGSEIVSEFQRDLQPVFRPSGSGTIESTSTQ